MKSSFQMVALKFNNVCVQVDSSISMELLAAEGLCENNLKQPTQMPSHLFKSGSSVRNRKQIKLFLLNVSEQFRKLKVPEKNEVSENNWKRNFNDNPLWRVQSEEALMA